MPGRKLITLVAMMAFALPVGAMASGSNDNTACKSTATTMHTACRHDVNDDYNQILANCENISDWSERRACYMVAREVRQEEYQGCQEVRTARKEACDLLEEGRYDPDPLLDPSIDFVDPDDVPDEWPANPYVSVVAGHTFVLDVTEDGELAEKVIVHVTEDVREILSVPCRVVVDIVVEESIEDSEVEYEAVEVTDDWFAQDEDGNVYYCGEIARNYEDGVLRNLDGSFEAGVDFAKAGLLASAFPVPGDTHRQEFALGEAEDIIQYVSLATAPAVEEGGDNASFPCEPDNCLKTFDFAPIDPASTEYKYYLPGTGFILAVTMEDGEITGEREELVCMGESLDILSDPSCGFEDPEKLLEELCNLSPGVYCGD